MNFDQLEITSLLLKALNDLDYKEATPIQIEAIPQLLQGADLLATAQTGTGKTAAFGLPLLQKIIAAKAINPSPVLRGLIIAPTRELAAQIASSLKDYARYAKVKITVVYGGVGKSPQITTLRQGVDILVATPGRLLDLVNMRAVNLRHVNYFVLDEADQMLDMGFMPDIKKIISYLPSKRQTMLFSATMPDAITELTDSLMNDPIRLSIGSVQEPLDAITQGVYFVSKENKANLLIQLMKDKEVESALIFCRTKHGSDRLEKELSTQPFSIEVIHGNKGQQMRMQALQKFKSKKSRGLIATDIAARGLDINKISHVFNYDLPQTPETYLHRMGRTGRAGQVGNAISFCANEERGLLKDIQRHIGVEIPVLVSSTVASPIYRETKSSSSRYNRPKQPTSKPSDPLNFFQRSNSNTKARKQKSDRYYQDDYQGNYSKTKRSYN